MLARSFGHWCMEFICNLYVGILFNAIKKAGTDISVPAFMILINVVLLLRVRYQLFPMAAGQRL